MSGLTPEHVLADIFEEELFPDPEALAEAVVQRLRDAGFETVPADAEAALAETRRLIARDEFAADILIGMIKGIVRRGGVA